MCIVRPLAFATAELPCARPKVKARVRPNPFNLIIEAKKKARRPAEPLSVRDSPIDDLGATFMPVT